LARLARAQKARSLSFTYSEPTVFYEFAKEAAQAGSRLGLPSIWVTNGYMGPAVMEELGSLAAMNIDLKGYSQEFYRKVAKGSLEPVKQNIARAAKLGIWLEVTTLLIPGWNDSDEELNGLAAFLFSVSPELPWHINRFVPHRHQSDVRPTPIALLERARDIGKEAGLSYVYLGNVSGPGYADTFCPHCRRPLVRREDFGIISCFLGEGGHCPDCGKLIAGRWD
jgi:pyruvate formate lyase activating enzyme